MADTWITFAEAVRIVTEARGGSIGRAEALVRAALASGEVRSDPRRGQPLLLMADDGIVGMDLRPGRYRGATDSTQGDTRFSKDDFIDWLHRQAPALQSEPKPEPAADGTEGGHLAKLARSAAAAIWPDGIPADTPPQVLFKRVADRVQQQHQVTVSKSTVRRALGLK